MIAKRTCVVLFFTAALGNPLTLVFGQTKSSTAVSTLSDRYPGVQIRTGEDGSVAIFGPAMSPAATAQKAAALFFEQHAGVFGVPDLDLRLAWKADLGSGKGMVLAYQQYLGGLPVEYGIARVLIRSGPAHAVTYAAARVSAQRLPFEPDMISGNAARDTLRLQPGNEALSRWSAPELVMYAGEPETGRRDPARAWKISAITDRNDQPRAWTFFVNAANGRLIFSRNEIYEGGQIAGHVSGLATPGTLPDTAANPPISTPLSNLFVRDLLGNLAMTESDGSFSLLGDGSETSLSAVLAGPFVEVRDPGNQPAFLTQPASPPGPADFVFNSVPSEVTTAQVNALVQVNATHDFYKRYQPDFDRLDLPVTANVNLTSLSCNAFFTPVGLSVNFFASDNQCVNSAYSTVVNHEFGHFIVNQLRLAQGSFGEGFADTVAIMMHDNPIVGADFFGPGTFVRDIAGANQQFPCSSEIHTCGQVLAGAWWDIKLNLQETLGDPAGLELARQLFTDWSQITLGGRLRNAAHPGTPPEVLIVDDNDADLSNGTPHTAEICDAFAAHNISCPGVLNCGSLSMRVACRRGTISASVTGEPNALITLVLDGITRQSETTSGLGRGFLRFPNAGSGQHQICVDGCDLSCRTVTCR